jgi:serine/threonine-protein kinase HipA
MTRRANVRQHGRLCGYIEETPSRTYVYSYEAAWLGNEREWLSLTLPFDAHREPRELQYLPSFLEGLIPEGWLLAVASKIRPSLASDHFGLLLALAHDCIGSASVEEAFDSDEDSSAVRPTEAMPIAISVDTSRPRENVYGRCLACMHPLPSKTTFYHEDCAEHVFGTRTPFDVPFAQEQIEELAKQNIAARLIVPGAQRKISSSLLPAEGGSRDRLTLVGAGDGLFILKPEHPEVPTFPANEHLAMSLMAKAGVPTARHALVMSADGKLAYVTRRFDREVTIGGGLKRLSMEDFGQLFDRVRRPEDKYKGSYDRVGSYLRASSPLPQKDTVQFFDQVFISYLIGNNDFHLRNLSVFTSENAPRLTPAYDVTSTQLIDFEPDEDVTLPVDGRKTRLRRRNWLEFAGRMGIAERIATRRMDRLENLWPDLQAEIRRSLLPEEQKTLLQKLMHQRVARALEREIVKNVAWEASIKPETNGTLVEADKAETSKRTDTRKENREQELIAIPTEAQIPATRRNSLHRAKKDLQPAGRCAFAGCDARKAPGKKLYCADHSRLSTDRKLGK